MEPEALKRCTKHFPKCNIKGVEKNSWSFPVHLFQVSLSYRISKNLVLGSWLILKAWNVELEWAHPYSILSTVSIIYIICTFFLFTLTKLILPILSETGCQIRVSTCFLCSASSMKKSANFAPGYSWEKTLSMFYLYPNFLELKKNHVKTGSSPGCPWNKKFCDFIVSSCSV